MIEIGKQFEPWAEKWKQIIKYVFGLLSTKKYRNPIILHIKKQKKEKEKKRGVSSYRNLSENE